MATFESYEKIIIELKQLSDGIAAGQLNESDLQRFVDLSQKLYERAVILNFKAMEAKVFEAKNTREVAPEMPSAETITPPEVAKPIADKINKEEPSILFDFSTEPDDEVEEITEELTEVAPIAAGEEDNPATETIREEQNTVVNDDAVSVFYQRFSKVHRDSLNDQLSNAKIESLHTAFGLNDKMRIISELFHGESEAFSVTIAHLDQLSSGETARKELSSIAAARQWDVENDMVEEFVKLVNRKFD